MARCKAQEILRTEAYLCVRRKDEGRLERRRWPFFSILVDTHGQSPWRSLQNTSYA